MRRPLALLLALAACSPKAPPPPPKGFTVERGFIRDPQGRAVILRGANVSGQHKHPPYFDFHGAADFARMRSGWGLNAVRFLVEWAAVEPQRDAYDDAYLDEVARRVKLATDAGLLVFVDLHQDVYGEGFGDNGAPRWTCDAANYAAYAPTTPWFLNYLSPQVTACFDAFWRSKDLQAKYLAAWTRVATRLKDDPGFLGVDPMNEPYWGSLAPDAFEQVRLAPLHVSVANAVRAQKADLLLFAEPAASRNLGLASKLPPLSVGGVVYAPHSYDGDAERGLGFDPSRRALLIDNVVKLKAEAEVLGAALVLGEYGGVAANPGISEYMDATYAATGQVAGGAMYWHYGKDDGYGLLTPDGGAKPALLAAVARPYPERTAGEPLGYSVDGGTFTASWKPDPAVTAPTVIAVPTETWPAGFGVQCTGCTATVLEGRVELTATPGAAEAAVTLTR